MTKKTSPHDLLEALGSVKPASDTVTNSWYIGRREQTLRTVLTRAAEEPDDTAPTVAPPTWRRHPRRTIMAGLAAVAMAGGGVAWAYTQFSGQDHPGLLDGLTCVTDWSAFGTPNDVDVDVDEQYGGAPLSNDPVADCIRYAELTGKPRIEDPVAVHWQDRLIVGPRAGKPADATPAVVEDDPRVFELENSLEDYVDGGYSQCFDEDAGAQFAQSELGRLGLTDWTVATGGGRKSGPCASLFIFNPGVIDVRMGSATPEPMASSGLAPELHEQVAGKCLSLSEAEAVVENELAGEHHWATSTRLDPTADCTRVDLVIGGSQQVFLYGPETARR